VYVLAIRRDPRLLTPPTPETHIQLGDELVAIDTAEQLKALEGQPERLRTA